MDNHFGGVIWTNHALDRLRERGIKQGDAWATWRNPQNSKKGKSGSWVYYRNYGGTRIEVVAKQNERKEWLILSVWSKTINEKNTPNEAHTTSRSGYILPTASSGAESLRSGKSSHSSTALRPWYSAKGDKNSFREIIKKLLFG